MQKKHQANLMLFKALTGKSIISAPIMKEPTAGYQQSRSERYWK